MKVKAASAACFQEIAMTAANAPQFHQDPDRLNWADVEECGLQPVATGSDASDVTEE
ncbi:hypothetical protein [Xanthomonas arboricola]|uniref:Uncharacterized protein n=1 Tax=Xanthomonas arboricola TaxID=56448 RepID=A0AB73H286_9XANT|nr:hypothetical protein [Xanthomonas arboricola]MBB5672308.1 hypothetical protein [Xanthomonas arboricola]